MNSWDKIAAIRMATGGREHAQKEDRVLCFGVQDGSGGRGSPTAWVRVKQKNKGFFFWSRGTCSS